MTRVFPSEGANKEWELRRRRKSGVNTTVFSFFWDGSEASVGEEACCCNCCCCKLPHVARTSNRPGACSPVATVRLLATPRPAFQIPSKTECKPRRTRSHHQSQLQLAAVTLQTLASGSCRTGTRPKSQGVHQSCSTSGRPATKMASEGRRDHYSSPCARPSQLTAPQQAKGRHTNR